MRAKTTKKICQLGLSRCMMQAEEREQTRSTGDDYDEGRGYEILLTFLSTIEQSAVLLEAEVDVNEICASEQLHDYYTPKRYEHFLMMKFSSSEYISL